MQLCQFPVRGVNRRPVQDPGDLARHHGDAAGDPGARGQELPRRRSVGEAEPRPVPGRAQAGLRGH
ncbi:hypothetical protein THAOC_19738, partial [Thalassiosira oceanica]